MRVGARECDWIIYTLCILHKFQRHTTIRKIVNANDKTQNLYKRSIRPNDGNKKNYFDIAIRSLLFNIVTFCHRQLTMPVDYNIALCRFYCFTFDFDLPFLLIYCQQKQNMPKFEKLYNVMAGCRRRTCKNGNFPNFSPHKLNCSLI